jgi:hypothetical protein
MGNDFILKMHAIPGYLCKHKESLVALSDFCERLRALGISIEMDENADEILQTGGKDKKEVDGGMVCRARRNGCRRFFGLTFGG